MNFTITRDRIILGAAYLEDETEKTMNSMKIDMVAGGVCIKSIIPYKYLPNKNLISVHLDVFLFHITVFNKMAKAT